MQESASGGFLRPCTKQRIVEKMTYALIGNGVHIFVYEAHATQEK